MFDHIFQGRCYMVLIWLWEWKTTYSLLQWCLMLIGSRWKRGFGKCNQTHLFGFILRKTRVGIWCSQGRPCPHCVTHSKLSCHCSADIPLGSQCESWLLHFKYSFLLNVPGKAVKDSLSWALYLDGRLIGAFGEWIYVNSPGFPYNSNFLLMCTLERDSGPVTQAWEMDWDTDPWFQPSLTWATASMWMDQWSYPSLFVPLPLFTFKVK